MLEHLEDLPKEKLIDIIRMFASDVMTMDGLWFIGVEEKYGLEEAIRIDTEAWRQYGPIGARRIKKTLGITGDDTEALAKALNYQAWVCALGFEFKVAELTENKVIFNVTDCRPQRARIRNNMGEFNCKPVGIAYFEEFAKAINPKFKMKCLICPPDTHPDDLWCSWEFSLE